MMALCAEMMYLSQASLGFLTQARGTWILTDNLVAKKTSTQPSPLLQTSSEALMTTLPPSSCASAEADWCRAPPDRSPLLN